MVQSWKQFDILLPLSQWYSGLHFSLCLGAWSQMAGPQFEDQ